MFSGFKSYLVTLLLLIGTVSSINGRDASDILRAADQSLMAFMVRSSALSQENPTRSLSCFDYYVPVLNGITAEYERSYAACLSVADDQRSEIDNSTQPERNEIESNARDACNALSACSLSENSISYFECYVDAGSNNTKVMYAISANSSVILAEIRERYRLVENEQNRCTNASERAYVENTSATYEELQACLQGKNPVPTTPQPNTSTSLPPVETTTTDEPDEPSSSTSPPEEPTTEQPEETTSAPLPPEVPLS